MGDKDILQTQQGKLVLPEDDKSAWEVMLFWLMRHTIPGIPAGCCSASDSERNEWNTLLVRCWLLGGKYNIPSFQDHIMAELLECMRSHGADLDLIKEAFEGTPVGSPLRKLMAEEAVLCVEEGECEHSDLDIFDGCVGFTSAYSAAYQDYI